MSQNLVSLNFTDADLTAVDAALTELENRLGGLIALTMPQKKSIKRMGEKSEAFCRQALRVLEQNPQVVSPNLAVAAAQSDLQTLDRLRPRMVRLSRLSERAADTDVALGSDIMRVALQGYGLLKVSGRAEGLEGLRRELGARFTRSSRPAEAKAA